MQHRIADAGITHPIGIANVTIAPERAGGGAGKSNPARTKCDNPETDFQKMGGDNTKVTKVRGENTHYHSHDAGSARWTVCP